MTNTRDVVRLLAESAALREDLDDLAAMIEAAAQGPDADASADMQAEAIHNQLCWIAEQLDRSAAA